MLWLLYLAQNRQSLLDWLNFLFLLVHQSRLNRQPNKCFHHNCIDKTNGRLRQNRPCLRGDYSFHWSEMKHHRLRR